MFRHYEMERTCKRDSTVWYVSVKQAKEKAPGRFEMAAANTRALGDRVSMSHKHVSGELHVANLEQRAERVRSSSQCPTCGSTSFRQRKVRA